MTRRPRARSATTALITLVSLLALPLSAQTLGQDGLLDYDALTSVLQELDDAHGNLVSLEPLARSDEGREIWKLALGSPDGRPLDQRPALLVVANLEANHLVGSSTAVHLARHLLAGYGSDEDVTRLLDERTVYILPRMNPDGAERVWSMPGYELPYKPHPDAPERGGMNVRELGRDLNGDGLVTLMRGADPEGSLIPDPDEPRLLREADRARAERGSYLTYVEGLDPEDAEAYVPMGSDGVNLNRNFPHEYLYFEPHVGPHQVSEVETRALADLMFEQVNIAAVLTFSPYDNLRSPPPERRTPPEGVAPGPPAIPDNVVADDRPFFEFIAERFTELTGLEGDGEEGEAGSFAQFAYYQVGIPSFTTPVWTLEGEDDDRNAAWLAHFGEHGIDGFVEWSEAEHPQLGTVEVGGFVPNSRVNPPADELEALAALHTEFATWLAQQLPELEIVDTEVESRGDHVYQVSATIANERYLPTHFRMGQRVRTNRPVTARLADGDGVTVLSGDIQQQVARVEGMGGRHTFRWLVQAAPGTRVTLELFAERAGGLQSTSIELR